MRPLSRQYLTAFLKREATGDGMKEKTIYYVF
jgi:hypothetical protein